MSFSGTCTYSTFQDKGFSGHLSFVLSYYDQTRVTVPYSESAIVG